MAQLDLAVRRGRRPGARRIDLRLRVAARRVRRRRDHDGRRADRVLVDRLRARAPIVDRDESIGESLVSGLRFVFGESVLLSALTLDLFSVLLGGAEALLPVFADQILHVGPQGLGILRAAPAAGAVVASVYLAHRPPFKRAGRTLLYAVATFALCIIGFGLSRSFMLSVVAAGGERHGGQRERARAVDAAAGAHAVAMFGRVSSVNSIFVGSSNELGAFESGVAARLLGPVPSVVLGGLASLGVVGGDRGWRAAAAASGANRRADAVSAGDEPASRAGTSRGIER